MKWRLLIIIWTLAFFGGLFSGKSIIFASDEFDRQTLCLAKNMYWESRNQSFRGLIAVGNVVMNRVSDKRYPNSICEVVEQGPTRPSWKNPEIYYPIKNRCHFSWYCDGKSDAIPKQDRRIFEIIRSMAVKVHTGWFDDLTYGATHYHAYYVKPEWAKTKTKTIRIDDHIFYRWEK